MLTEITELVKDAKKLSERLLSNVKSQKKVHTKRVIEEERLEKEQMAEEKRLEKASKRASERAKELLKGLKALEKKKHGAGPGD